MYAEQGTKAGTKFGFRNTRWIRKWLSFIKNIKKRLLPLLLKPYVLESSWTIGQMSTRKKSNLSWRSRICHAWMTFFQRFVSTGKVCCKILGVHHQPLSPNTKNDRRVCPSAPYPWRLELSCRSYFCTRSTVVLGCCNRPSKIDRFGTVPKYTSSQSSSSTYSTYGQLWFKFKSRTTATTMWRWQFKFKSRTTATTMWRWQLCWLESSIKQPTRSDVY